MTLSGPLSDDVNSTEILQYVFSAVKPQLSSVVHPLTDARSDCLLYVVLTCRADIYSWRCWRFCLVSDVVQKHTDLFSKSNLLRRCRIVFLPSPKNGIKIRRSKQVSKSLELYRQQTAVTHSSCLTKCILARALK